MNDFIYMKNVINPFSNRKRWPICWSHNPLNEGDPGDQPMFSRSAMMFMQSSDGLYVEYLI